MTCLETQEILKWVDAALGIYAKNEGRLSVREIRLKSLFSVIRMELLEQLREDTALASSEDESS